MCKVLVRITLCLVVIMSTEHYLCTARYVRKHHCCGIVTNRLESAARGQVKYHKLCTFYVMFNNSCMHMLSVLVNSYVFYSLLVL